MINAKKGYRFGSLLFFLLLYIMMSPFLIDYPRLSIIAHATLSVTLCVCVYAVRRRQNHRNFAIGLILPVLILYWLGIYDIVHFGRLGSYGMLAIYLGLLIHAFGIQILRSGRISLEVIFATLCLYLIIGMFWGALYAILYELSPQSYSGALLDNTNMGSLYTTFNYFSMVTLTTLGYGDITPQTPGAGALCQVEAIIGQFYTAVVVAWLVGNFVVERKPGGASGESDPGKEKSASIKRQ